MSEMPNLKYRILVIEKSPEVRKKLRSILEQNEFLCDIESSASGGYKKIQQRHHDLIICEVADHPAEMTGLDLLRTVRESNLTVPFVIISDPDSIESSMRAINYGVAGYLVKPLVPTEVIETVRRAIRHHKGRFQKTELENYRIENAFKAVITSEEKSILKLLDTVDNLIELVYPDDHASFPDLKMAIYESLSNAVEHGNRNQRDKSVFFKLALRMDKITVQVKDEGEGFDPSLAMSQRDVVKGLNRGLTLIHHLMDEVSFNTKGNEINLLKILN
jgi:serine/threonine-protein kinase RsbW